MIDQNAEKLSILLKSMANPTRLKILCLLREREYAVGEIQSVLETTTANISQHLTVLRRNGIVESRKEANVVLNRIADGRVLLLIETLYDLYCKKENVNAA